MTVEIKTHWIIHIHWILNQISMLIVQKTSVLNVIYWTDNCYLCQIMVAPWRAIKDFGHLQSGYRKWLTCEVGTNQFLFVAKQSGIISYFQSSNMDFEYVSLYQRDMHNKCCNGRAWCVKVRFLNFILMHFLVNVIHVLLLIELKDICGIICAAMTWFLIFFAGMSQK